MAVKKKKTQAEKAVSASSGKSKSNTTKENKQEKSTPKERSIPVRFYTSATFLGLFVLFLIISMNQEGALTGLICKLMYGLIGVAGFIISIPVLLYLFFIHAFSGKRPVKMRTICLIGFVLLCGCLHHLFSSPDISTGLAMFADLYEKGSYSSGGVICGSVVVLLNYLLNPWITGIILVVAAVFLLLGGMQITVPSIIRAIQNRPRADWEDEELEEQPEPAAIVVNHIANKRIEYVENKRAKARAAAEMAETKEDRVSEMMRQIGDIDVPVSAATASSSETPSSTRSSIISL